MFYLHPEGSLAKQKRKPIFPYSYAIFSLVIKKFMTLTTINRIETII